MNIFVVVRPTSDWMHENLVRRAVKYGLRYAPVVAKRITARLLHPHETLIFALEANDPLGTGGYTFTSDSAATLFYGTPWTTDGPLTNKRSWAEQLHEYLLTTSLPERAYRRLRGTYGLVHTAEGCLHAFGDFSGLKPMYYSGTPDAVGVSNNPLLLHMLTSREALPAWNLGALAWLPAQMHVMGNESTLRNVQFLKPGMRLCCATDGTLTISKFDWQFWKRSDESRSDFRPADFDDALSAIEQNFLVLQQLSKRMPMRLSLTGGRDSRVNLAYAQALAMHSDVEFFTRGREGSPEIECAEHLANICGVNLTKEIGSPSSFDLSDRWEILRYHVFRNAASVSPWDGSARPARSVSVEITGVGGELCRSHVKSRKRITVKSVEEVKSYHSAGWQVPLDPLGLMRRQVREEVVHQAHAWVDQRRQEGVDPSDMDDLYYADNRLNPFAGVIDSNIRSTIRFYPLIHADCVALMYNIGTSVDRASDRFHFEILKRLSPRLTAAPLLGEPWDERLKPLFGALPIVPTPFQPARKVEPQNLVSWQWEFIEQGAPQITDLLLGSPNSGLYDIIDRDKVESLRFGSAKRTYKSVEVHEWLSLIAIQLALTGGYTIARDSFFGTSERAQLDTNIDGLHLEQSEGGQRFACDGIDTDTFPSPVDLDIESTPTRKTSSFHTDVSKAASDLARITGGIDLRDLQAPTAGATRFADVQVGKLCVPTYRFRLPSERIVRLRIDPTDSKSDLLIASAVILLCKERIEFDLREPTQVILNSQLEYLGRTKHWGRYRALGNDPMIVWNDLAPLDLRSCAEATIEIQLLVSAGRRIELFWDFGTGFAQTRSIGQALNLALLPVISGALEFASQ